MVGIQTRLGKDLAQRRPITEHHRVRFRPELFTDKVDELLGRRSPGEMDVVVHLHRPVKVGPQQIGLRLVLDVAIQRNVHLEGRRQHLQPLEAEGPHGPVAGNLHEAVVVVDEFVERGHLNEITGIILLGTAAQLDHAVGTKFVLDILPALFQYSIALRCHLGPIAILILAPHSAGLLDVAAGQLVLVGDGPGAIKDKRSGEGEGVALRPRLAFGGTFPCRRILLLLRRRLGLPSSRQRCRSSSVGGSEEPCHLDRRRGCSCCSEAGTAAHLLTHRYLLFLDHRLLRQVIPAPLARQLALALVLIVQGRIQRGILGMGLVPTVT
mmetsp:Transcript_1944/g.5645  ORF Transcript_1944/g.5645 Transcript_1944/m.5645 type:complete len:324 (-) Transcript_1944:357-1328(-)